MTERQWLTSDFDYHLPDSLIAQHPATERGASRLLLVEGKPARCSDHPFAALAELIPAGDLLVLNSTRVRHARLPGHTPGGGDAEILLIHPNSDGSWIAMGRPGRAMRAGKTILLQDGTQVETLEVMDDGLRKVRFVGTDAESVIARLGKLPLPPYINRPPTAEDEDRYQTIFASREGSVAAPTAGLHFTSTLLDILRQKGVTISFLDLEVGPGTFKPVESENAGEHHMHTEAYEIPDSLARDITECRQRGGHIWAVGTTVVRSLEAAATGPASIRTGRSQTALFITPGHRFRLVDRLITNFHLPRSTLLMLVAAFAGYETTMAAYRHAVEQQYRFYSYGDAMCIIPEVG